MTQTKKEVNKVRPLLFSITEYIPQRFDRFKSLQEVYPTTSPLPYVGISITKSLAIDG